MQDILYAMDKLFEEGYVDKVDLSGIEEEIEKVMQVPIASYRATQLGAGFTNCETCTCSSCTNCF